MRIAVNTRLLLKDRLEGIGLFTASILKELVEKHPEVEWTFIFDRPFDAEFIFNDKVKTKVLFPPTRHPLLWHLWFQWVLPRYLKRMKADLFISPDGMIPLWGSTPSISVIHDLNFVHQPKNLDPVAGSYMRHFYPKFARKARRLVTVSDFCKEDLVQTYKLNTNSIDLVPNAYGHQFKPIPEGEKEALRKEYAHGQKYYLYLGALNPRKNIDGLLDAYQEYREAGGQNRLLIVGEKMLWTTEIEAAYRRNKFQEDIHFTGRLDNSTLAKVVAAAQALCLVSHFEGFGIPILEAFASDTPVICADNTAMPEVAGGAALLVNSRSTTSISQALLSFEDDALADEYIEKGRKRLKDFSWSQSAEAMWNSISKCF